MTRHLKLWTPEPVPDDVAPHHYRSDSQDAGPSFTAADTRGWRDHVPYKPRDVVWIDHHNKPVKARIVHVLLDFDRAGFVRPLFRVQLATAKGLWSRALTKKWEGHIQRGYLLAGFEG